MGIRAKYRAIAAALLGCACIVGADAGAGVITVAAPNGSEVWNVGETCAVMWSSADVTGNVYVWLYNNWTKVRKLATVNVAEETYYWPIPANEPAGNLYRVRIQSAADTSVSDYSGTFTILAPKSLFLTVPNGGEVWNVEESRDIAWTTTGLWGNANIYLYDNWTKIRKLATAPIQNGTWTWPIPSNEIAGNTYRIRVQSALDTAWNDYSDAKFTVTGERTIAVISPNGGENWERGTAQFVAWHSTGLWGNANIYLYNNWTKLGLIGTTPIHNGSWTWNIPQNQTLRSTYRIRVQSLLDTGVNDYSNGLFAIDEDGSEQTFLLPGNVPLTMAWIPAGSFWMGRYSGEQDSDSDEDPQHPVTLSGFWMGKYEVTKAQWTAVMGTTPWAGQTFVLNDPNSPAVYVSWDDAQSFITALNSYTGQTFKLPSESQWEYACRAGTTTRFYWGDDASYTVGNDYVWWTYNACDVNEKYAHVVGLRLKNGYGLYDVSGNVWEWCQDWYHSNYTDAPTDGSAWESPAGSFRVARGGGWADLGHYCRSAYRGGDTPSDTSGGIGFRLAR